ATVGARGIKAYGASLDSARLRQTYSVTRGAYVLEEARLHAGKRAWNLSGAVTLSQADARPGRDGVAVRATLAQTKGTGRGGSLRFTLDPDGTMEATARTFEATALPHAVADSMPLHDAMLDGVFR